MPVVSIVTPLYNKVGYLTEAVESVLAQTFTDWELIIVDNGSTDGGYELARTYEDPRIRVTEEHSKQGPGAARNKGVSLAKGEWTLFFDSDDLLEPNHLEALLKRAAEVPEADMVAGGWVEFTDAAPDRKTNQHPGRIGDAAAIRNSAIAAPPWAIHAAIVRTARLGEHYLWPEELDRFTNEDVVFWFRLIADFDFAICDSSGALYRMQTPGCRSPVTDTRRRVPEFEMAEEYNVRYLEETGRTVTAEHCEMFVRVFSRLFLDALDIGDRQVARRASARATAWLRRYFEVAERPKWPMVLRRRLGIPLSTQLLAARQQLGNKRQILKQRTTAVRDMMFKFRHRFGGVPVVFAEHTLRLDETLRRWNIAVEKSLQDAMVERIQPGDLMIDVGAHFGMHTLLAACLVGEKGKVVAFDPTPATVRLLRRNLGLNGLNGRVTVVESAVSNSAADRIEFFIPREGPMVEASLQPMVDGMNRTMVANVRLDEFRKNLDRRVAFIKIDVEGAELEVLRGAKEMLREDQPVLAIEVHGFALPRFRASVRDLREFLESFGYTETLLEGQQFNGSLYFQALYTPVSRSESLERA